MERIRDAAKPLVGGSYAGVWTPRGGYVRPRIHYPEWRLQGSGDGMNVGWLDPNTDPVACDPLPAGKP
jgi:hypothetical protein